MKQIMAPILEGLINYTKKNRTPLHMPGHKQGRVIDEGFRQLMNTGLLADLTEIPGLDNLHSPEGIIKEAQELAAEAFKAEESFFLVNGTTCGIQGLLMTVCSPGDKIIITRHCHLSVLEGIILSGAHPVFLESEYHDNGFPLAVNPNKLIEILELHPEAKGFMMVNPTYYGITSNLVRLAQICHERNKVLLIDEAHGAHLCFHEKLPVSAMEAGADACVQSTHKMLGSMTQSSMLHIQGTRVDRDKLKASLSIVQSTSPSYLLMASLDGARRQAATEGRDLLDTIISLAGEARVELNRIDGIKVPDVDDLTEGSLDPLKILINVSDLGLSGYEAMDILAEEYGVQLEMADNYSMLAMYTIGTTPEECSTLIKAVKSMAAKVRAGNEVKVRDNKGLNKERIQRFTLPKLPLNKIEPRDAWFSETELVPLVSAAGRVAAGPLVPYPPGIPIIWPGEEISQEIIEYLLRHGGEDTNKETIVKVVKKQGD